MTGDPRLIISQSDFEVIGGSFVYTKVSVVPEADNHFMVTKDQGEITVVTDRNNLADLNTYRPRTLKPHSVIPAPAFARVNSGGNPVHL